MVQAEEVQAIAEDLIYWQVYDPGVKCDLSSIAYYTDRGWIWVDPVLLEETCHAEMVPRDIVLTNGNHARAADLYRRKYGCPIWASSAAAAELTIRVDGQFELKEIPWDLTVIPIPGATAGETAFLTPQGYLFLGDAIINLEGHGFTFLPEKYCLDASQNRASLSTLIAYDFSVITFAHGLPICHRAKETLQTLLAAR